MRSNKIITALRNGEPVEVEDSVFRMIEGDIEIGDWYIAERNIGPQLLTAKEFVYYLGSDVPSLKTHENVKKQGEIIPEDWKLSFDPESTVNPSWINPEENAYPYNWGECIRVELV